MGLTKIRAAQISNIDYKQSCRVLTATNITLSGGAPAEVDSVSVSVNDRVLVIGQTNKTQNGLYRVDILGTGSNGTWVRTGDTDTAGELEAGAIVMVTEGTVYKDTQWKLITNDPIVIGSSELIFELNSAFAFGNIYANGTAVLANTVGDAVTFTAGNNISIIGNASTKSVTIGVTGISLNSISNGDSSVAVTESSGNVSVTVDGNVVTLFTATESEFTGNITANYFIGNGSQLTDVQAGPVTTFSTTPPENPKQGDVWIAATTGIQYIYFDDGTSSQWAEMEADISISSGGGGGGGTPGGSNTQIQFNNAGAFGGSANLTWNGSQLTVTGTANISGNISANYFVGNGSQLTGISGGGNPGQSIMLALVFR